MTLDTKVNLITRNLQEFIGIENINEAFQKNEIVNLYWGTAPTGRPHIAYFLPMTKLADFLKAGCSVTILFANLHAYLDNMKAPWELLQKRTEYYEVLIKGMLKALNVPLKKLNFIRGTEYQLMENYTASVYRIIGITTAHDAAKAGCEVVKQTSDPFISGIIYPLLQALDEEFLGVDAQFGGVDQRKIFTYAEKYLPNLGFAKRSHFMNPMIPGLTGGKMSASEENSKIDLLDTEETIKRKLKTANCSEPTSQTNGILAFIKFVILPIKSQLNIDSLNKYTTIEEIESDYASGEINEDQLKEIVERALCSLMCNLKEEFALSGKPDLDKEAYPDVIPESHPESNLLMKKMTDFPTHLESLQTMFPEISQLKIEEFPEITDKPTILWSCRASGEPYLGYLVPIMKLAGLSNHNWKVVIVIEDIGAYMHSQHSLNKPSWGLLKQRADLYRDFLLAAFTNFNGDLSNLDIKFGSDFQLSSDYALLLYQSFSRMTERECNAMLQKMVGNQTDIASNLSSVVYPCMAVLDQLHFQATVRLFGKYSHVDDFNQFAYNLATRLHTTIRNPVIVKHDMILSLDGANTMKCPKIGAKTAPKDNTSLTLCEDFETSLRKMKKAYFDPKDLSHDPSLNIIELVVWPNLADGTFTVKRSVENGGNVTFHSIADIRQQLLADLMHPGDIKLALAEHLHSLFLTPITKILSTDTTSLLRAAFPAESKKFKTNKKNINPNKLDLRIATVKSISYTSGTFTIDLQSGLELFQLTKSHFYKWTPNDAVVIAVVPSSHDSKLRLIGLVGNKTTELPLKLTKKPYLPCITIENHNGVLPHLKENDEALIRKQVEENLVVRQGNLEWIKDGSLSREITVLMTKTDEELVKLTIVN